MEPSGQRGRHSDGFLDGSYGLKKGCERLTDDSEDSRLKTLESELSEVKIQIQQTLLDIREHVLEFTNPFTAEARLVRQLQERSAPETQTNLTDAPASRPLVHQPEAEELFR